MKIRASVLCLKCSALLCSARKVKGGTHGTHSPTAANNRTIPTLQLRTLEYSNVVNVFENKNVLFNLFNTNKRHYSR